MKNVPAIDKLVEHRIRKRRMLMGTPQVGGLGSTGNS